MKPNDPVPYRSLHGVQASRRRSCLESRDVTALHCLHHRMIHTNLKNANYGSRAVVKMWSDDVEKYEREPEDRSRWHDHQTCPFSSPGAQARHERRTKIRRADIVVMLHACTVLLAGCTLFAAGFCLDLAFAHSSRFLRRYPFRFYSGCARACSTAGCIIRKVDMPHYSLGTVVHSNQAVTDKERARPSAWMTYVVQMVACIIVRLLRSIPEGQLPRI